MAVIRFHVPPSGDDRTKVDKFDMSSSVGVVIHDSARRQMRRMRRLQLDVSMQQWLTVAGLTDLLGEEAVAELKELVEPPRCRRLIIIDLSGENHH